MTREVIREVINELKKYTVGKKNAQKTEISVLALNRLIFALEEQEPVLDKIRAEIDQITDTMGVSYNQYVSKIDVLQIIDKYKANKDGEE